MRRSSRASSRASCAPRVERHSTRSTARRAAPCSRRPASWASSPRTNLPPPRSRRQTDSSAPTSSWSIVMACTRGLPPLVVGALAGLDASVTVERPEVGRPAAVTGPTALLAVGGRQGETLRFAATGTDATQALERIGELVDERLRRIARTGADSGRGPGDCGLPLRRDRGQPGSRGRRSGSDARTDRGASVGRSARARARGPTSR